MVTTNLCMARDLSGAKLCEADLKVGLLINYPSGLGGVFEYECTSINSEKAEFKCTNPDWPYELSMEFGQADFELADFERLSTAITIYDSWNSLPSDEDRAIVKKAEELGYACARSYTQAHWTEAGLEKYRALQEVQSVNK